MPSRGAWMRAEARWAVERGDPRCEAITNKGTRCVRLSPLRKVDVITEWNSAEPGKSKREKQWRCRQHGG